MSNPSVIPASSPVQVGDIIAEKYRVDRVLGEGGMGVVVAVTHLALQQRFAMKFLLPTIATMPELVSRFTREAQAAVRIHSEHVSRVVDVGVLPNGSPYMLMEYLEGQDLGQLLLERTFLPVQESVDYVLQALEAIAEAHSLGIVHRDLKPGNLFVARRPSGQSIVKVLDFGISKIENGGMNAALTGTGALIGSPGYMSPEQMVEANTVDRTTDIWAMGVVLYELLSGRRPFDAETMPELVATVLAKPHVSLVQIVPGIPPLLSAAVDHCLVKERGGRFQDVGQLARALAPFGPAHAQQLVDRIIGVLGGSGPMPVFAPSPSSGASGMSGAPPRAQGTFAATSTGARDPSPPARSGAALLAIGAFVVLAVLVGAGTAAWKFTRDRNATTTAPSGAVTLTATSSGVPSATSAAPPTVTTPPVDHGNGPDAPPITPDPSVSDAGIPTSPDHPTTPPSTTHTTRPHPSAVASGHAIPGPSAAASAPKCKTVKYYDDMGEEHFRYDCPASP